MSDDNASQAIDFDEIEQTQRIPLDLDQSPETINPDDVCSEDNEELAFPIEEDSMCHLLSKQ